jgi:hypothetical protein
LISAAETYPGAIWPGQIADSLRGLIHPANQARGKGLAAVPGDIAAPLVQAFRHGVLAGLSEIPRPPRPQAAPRPRSARMPARPPGRRAAIRV